MTTTTQLPQITRSDNGDGTYRYEIDGKLDTKRSKVVYTHAPVFEQPELSDRERKAFVPRFTKTQRAAERASWHGLPKLGVVEITQS